MAEFFHAALAGAASLFSAHAPIGLLNRLVPRSGYDVYRDIAYGGDPRQMLDIYVPHGLTGPAPVLLFFHGGAWQSGRRGHYLAFGQAFASAGIVTIVADYRLYPQVRFPAFVQDGAAALAWAHAHAGEFGGDADRIFVSGHSAGAYNAVMLGADPQYLAAAGGTLEWVRGVIGIAGPYDILPLTDPRFIAIFNGANDPMTMPIHHVTGPRPPMLLAAGTADRTVGPANSTRMAARLATRGSAATLRSYAGIGHIGIILSLAAGFRGRTTLRQDMLDFMHGP